MDKVTFVTANIISVAPLYVGNDEDSILLDEDGNMALLPGTSITGAFRAYLKSIGEDEKLLFGESKSGQMSKIFVKDAYAKIKTIEKRDGLRIDGETGTNAQGTKIEKTYLGEGLTFKLQFEIHDQEGQKDKGEQKIEPKMMLYKALNALDKSIIRFGGHKSSGLGIFRLVGVTEMEYDLKNLDELVTYLQHKEKTPIDKTDLIKEEQSGEQYVLFIMRGSLSTPLLIKAPKTFIPGEADDQSLKNGKGKYIIPGSSLKGILRSRAETIANHFGSLGQAREIFGDVKKGGKDNILSRVFVKESIIDNEKYQKEVQYNRIKIDKFSAGVRKGSLMQDIPVKGDTDFHVTYRKTGDKAIDDYAIGLLAFALRDLGTENINLGGNDSIGRGRYKADTLLIVAGEDEIKIDFVKKTTSNQEAISKYIEAVKALKKGVVVNE